MREARVRTDLELPRLVDSGVLCDNNARVCREEISLSGNLRRRGDALSALRREKTKRSTSSDLGLLHEAMLILPNGRISDRRN